MAKVLNSNDFDKEISEGVVVVDFFATWCGPCKMLTPVFEELSSELEGKAKFAKVDIDQSIDIASKFQVVNVPTVKVFKNGEVVKTLVGFRPKEALLSELSDLI
ncbi:MAG: thioredoxin [Clostridium perfringens]|nr:thioredoxin [Clostridium perfringens]